MCYSLWYNANHDVAGHRPATSWVHYTTKCNTQSSAPEDGRDQRPKHVELIGIINKPLLLHLFGVYIIASVMHGHKIIKKVCCFVQLTMFFPHLQWQYNAKKGKGHVNICHSMTCFQRYAFCITRSTRTMTLFILQLICRILKRYR